MEPNTDFCLATLGRTLKRRFYRAEIFLIFRFYFHVIRCNLTVLKIAKSTPSAAAKSTSHIVVKPPAPVTDTIIFTPKTRPIFWYIILRIDLFN